MEGECRVVVKSIAKAEIIIDAAFDEVINAIVDHILEGGSANDVKKIYKSIIRTAIIKAYTAVEVAVEGNCKNVNVEAEARADAVIKIINDVQSKEAKKPRGPSQRYGRPSNEEVAPKDVVNTVSTEFYKALNYAKYRM
eukprot:TRINITY_DN4992_c0_g1_i3.p2 TRINITY_DN4992_c0_g1~~TRINITY_DN4992_c0_g1_i3.p2  ORF type:complete len:139 (+),score=28.52 TRINITY_DN4992_c0_g1_i3:190-606(+)